MQDPMENLTKHQLVLLVLLVSFVTALVTGIVTVVLMSQAPPPLTQSIQRVVEKIISPASSLQQDEEKQLETSATARDLLIENIASRVSPAVVSVIATKDIPVIEQYYVNPFDGGGNSPLDQFFQDFQVPQYKQNGTEQKQVSAGTGFFVSADGLILTNKHVVEDAAASYSVIMNDGKKMDAKVVARDPLNDMAVIKVDGSGYKFITLGDSRTAHVGDTVIAIGNALGEFQNTLSVGVVSGLSRSIVASGASSGPEELSQLLQTDAAINPGNSGGPLLNLKGEAIALNTAIASNAQSIGFAIPINQVKKSLNAVQTSGKITYPFLGVRYVLVTPDIKAKNKLVVDYGVLVTKGSNGEAAVTSDSPAAKAGIKEGDVILELNGTKIDSNHPLNKLIQDKNIGDKIQLKILHDGALLDVTAVLEERKF